MEKMLDLFELKPAITDKITASDLKFDKGVVEFSNVSFGYSGEHGLQTLRNISFKIASGTTTALVGTSGGGKTTVLRLLFRFYEASSGSILIDGQVNFV